MKQWQALLSVVFLSCASTEPGVINKPSEDNVQNIVMKGYVQISFLVDKGEDDRVRAFDLKILIRCKDGKEYENQFKLNDMTTREITKVIGNSILASGIDGSLPADDSSIFLLGVEKISGEILSNEDSVQVHGCTIDVDESGLFSGDKNANIRDCDKDCKR